MDNTLTKEVNITGTAELQAEIKRLFSEMEQADGRIQHCQQETDRLRAETWAILAKLKVQ